MLSEQRDAGEDRTHTLLKDIVALRGSIRSFSSIKICVCLWFCLGFSFYSATQFFTFYNCTQTALKVNLNLEAKFSINVPTSLQINPKQVRFQLVVRKMKENSKACFCCTDLLFPFVSSSMYLSLWIRSRNFPQGSGMAPSLHAGWRERPPGGFSPSCPSI